MGDIILLIVVITAAVIAFVWILLWRVTVFATSVQESSAQLAHDVASATVSTVGTEVAAQIRGDGPVTRYATQVPENEAERMAHMPWYMQPSDTDLDSIDPTDGELREPVTTNANRTALINEGENPFASLGLSRPDLSGEEADEFPQ